MRLLFVTPEFAPFARGGGPVHFSAMVNAVRRRGHEVKILSGLHSGYRGELTHEVVHCELLPAPGTFKLDLRAYTPPTPRAFLRLRAWLRAERYDVLHAFGYGHLFVDVATRLANTPYVATVMGAPNSQRHGPPALRLAYSLYDRMSGAPHLRRARIVHSISRGCLEHESLRDIARKAVVIPNGIDLPTVAPLPSFVTYDNFILSVGRIQHSKGFQQVIDLLPDLPTMNYVIAGPDAGYQAALSRLAHDRGVGSRVFFTGYVDQRVLEALYRDSRVVIIPSLFEPFGLVSLEAMIRRKPVVASRVEGLVDTIEHGKTGFLFSSGDRRGLRNALTAALGTRNDIIDAAYKRATDQSWDEIARQFDPLYDSIAAGRAG